MTDWAAVAVRQAINAELRRAHSRGRLLKVAAAAAAATFGFSLEVGVNAAFMWIVLMGVHLQSLRQTRTAERATFIEVAVRVHTRPGGVLAWSRTEVSLDGTRARRMTRPFLGGQVMDYEGVGFIDASAGLLVIPGRTYIYKTARV